MTVAMTFNNPAAGYAAQARRRRAAFGAARRHTRLVHFLRGAIPVAAVLLVLALVVIPFLSPLGGKLANVSVSSVGITGGKVRMETPKLTGYRKDNRPYQVTAENAFDACPWIMSLSTIAWFERLTRSCSSNSGANSRARIPASVFPTRNETIVPTFPNTAERTTGVS